MLVQVLISAGQSRIDSSLVPVNCINELIVCTVDIHGSIFDDQGCNRMWKNEKI